MASEIIYSWKIGGRYQNGRYHPNVRGASRHTAELRQTGYRPTGGLWDNDGRRRARTGK